MKSRNQECTITAIEYFIKKGILKIDQNYIKMIRSLKKTDDDAKKTREDMQYSSKTQLEKDRCKRLMENAKKFVEKIRSVLVEIKKIKMSDMKKDFEKLLKESHAWAKNKGLKPKDLKESNIPKINKKDCLEN